MKGHRCSNCGKIGHLFDNCSFFTSHELDFINNIKYYIRNGCDGLSCCVCESQDHFFCSEKIREDSRDDMRYAVENDNLFQGKLKKRLSQIVFDWNDLHQTYISIKQEIKQEYLQLK